MQFAIVSNPVLIWWFGLCVVALLNVVALGVSARLLARRQAILPGPVYRTRRVLLWLAAAYVLGCAFRATLPIIDAPRICIHDTALSTVFIGRSVATIAELCFAAQFAVVLNEVGKAIARPIARFVSFALVPIIVVAEGCSWLAVLKTANLLHALENSLWTLAAVLALAAFIDLRAHVAGRLRHVLAAAIAGGLVYIAFMVLIDVPMYLTRWRTSVAAGQSAIPLADGLNQILARCTVVRDWAAWREDVAWISLYFSAAVWVSIALPHIPRLDQSGPNRTEDDWQRRTG